MTKPAVTSVTISGLQGAMTIGDVRVLKATARYVDNTEEDVTRQAKWKSGDPAVFAVTKLGVLTATGKGLTGVEVSYLGATTLTMGVVDQPGCTYQVSPVAMKSFWRQDLGASIKITTQPGCLWTATSDASWIFLFPSSGSGSHSVSVSPSDFDTPLDDPIVERSGHVMVRWDTPTAGQNAVVTQTSQCSAGLFAAGPSSSSAFGPDGGSGHIEVFLPTMSHSPWQINSSVDWITVTSPAPGKWFIGIDGEDIHFTVSPNPGSATRVGTLSSCNSIFTVTQAGRSTTADR